MISFNFNHLKQIVIALIFTGALCTQSSLATGFSETMSAASNLSVNGLSNIVDGSVVGLKGVGNLSVTSVEMVGGSIVIGLNRVSNVGALSLKLTGRAVGTASLVVGESITYSANSLGYVFSKAGELLAFIPTELGKSMLHQSVYAR